MAAPTAAAQTAIQKSIRRAGAHHVIQPRRSRRPRPRAAEQRRGRTEPAEPGRGSRSVGQPSAAALPRTLWHEPGRILREPASEPAQERAARRRVGHRRGLCGGLRLRQPRLRKQRPPARHDAGRLSPRRPGRDLALHHADDAAGRAARRRHRARRLRHPARSGGSRPAGRARRGIPGSPARARRRGSRRMAGPRHRRSACRARLGRAQRGAAAAVRSARDRVPVARLAGAHAHPGRRNAQLFRDRRRDRRGRHAPAPRTGSPCWCLAIASCARTAVSAATAGVSHASAVCSRAKRKWLRGPHEQWRYRLRRRAP